VPALVLFDLDNTLLDREMAFDTWLNSFIEVNGLPEWARPLLKSLDADGITSRDSFFTNVRDACKITKSVDLLIADYYDSYPLCFAVDERVVNAVRQLRSSGWKVAIVTNGPPSQAEKIRVTNMGNEFDAICISDVVGSRKPDTRIFMEAARLSGSDLEGWMVGDSAEADIEGGRRAGLKTIWIARGRTWDAVLPEPDVTVDSVLTAVDVIMAVSATG
jgi:putative hydrolase of the HAD superfamily